MGKWYGIRICEQKVREIPQALMRMGSGELLHQSHSRVIDRI